MAIFYNSENALKRADELINVGQKQEALQVLHDLTTSRSFRTWQKPHEKIMFRYVELCVELRRGRFAKDGLIQYRNSCQQVNVTSFEEVTKQFIRLATEKAEQARSQVDTFEEEALDVDDLEADKKPEDLLMCILSGEKEKDRSDRETVTPWFKFLWETYRTVLEILQNNSKLQALYAMTAHKAFQFCKQYKRTTEFRRLCEIMRKNLANLNNYKDQRDRPDLTDPETLQLYLDTRFEQLKVATELELWQEAFRSVEDIYGLMCMVKKTPKSSLLVVYYSKLTEIFSVSSSHLYYAYALLKMFSLQKNFNKNLSQKDLQLIASSVVLAALSVPPFGQAHSASLFELEIEKERNLRMANLICFNLEPKSEARDMLSRESLLSELVSRGVLSYATQEVKDLYHLMEHEFQSLDLGSKTKSLLDSISKLGGKLPSPSSLPEVQLSQYVPSLEKLATLRLLKQVSKMYKTIRIDCLAQLVPFFDFSAVEKISLDAVKNNFVAMRVDHVKGVVTFGKLGIESDGLRDPLAIFAETMNKVRAMLFPAPSKTSKLGYIAPNQRETVEKEHKRLLARQSIIEKRKEEQERQQLEMEREEEQKRLNLLRLTEETEQKRLATEVEERMRQRVLREIEERELEEALALLEDFQKHHKKGKTITLLDGEKVTKQIVMERFMSLKRKEAQEREEKLRKLAETMDYLERAKREEAAPLIEAAHRQHQQQEREFHEREQKREFELSKERHERDLMSAITFSSESFLQNMEIFQKRVLSLRQAEFDRLKREKEEHVGQVIRARKQERDVKRKKTYYLKSEEERLKKLQEEEEARKLREPTVAASAAASDAAGPLQSPAKYVPPTLRRSQATEVSGSAPAMTPPAESDRRRNRGPLPADDQWRSRGLPPDGDGWRSEERGYTFRSSGPRSSSSSRTPDA